MDDLVAFVTARLDEDEAAAIVAGGVAGPDWTWRTVVSGGEVTDCVTGADGTVLLDTLGGIESEAPHVARHDPARVLREVEAMRMILARCGGYSGTNLGEHLQWSQEQQGLGFALRAQAAVWSDHPDWRPEWKP